MRSEGGEEMNPLKRFLECLEEEGVCLCTCLEEGWIFLSPDDALKFLENPKRFEEEYYGNLREREREEEDSF
jgi:hypothetical protein